MDHDTQNFLEVCRKCSEDGGNVFPAPTEFLVYDKAR